jgi:hypothetical protein
MRCNNGIPHSPYADFFKFADVVVEEAGLRKLSRPVLEQMEGTFAMKVSYLNNLHDTALRVALRLMHACVCKVR